MADFFLNQYPPALAATLAFELGVAILLGVWSCRQLLGVALTNLITHPALHVVVWALFATKALPLTWLVLVALEIVVFLAEWRLLAVLLRVSSRRAAGLSFACNATSALAGLWLTL